MRVSSLLELKYVFLLEEMRAGISPIIALDRSGHTVLFRSRLT